MMTDDAVIRKGQRPTCERAGRWSVELGMLQGQNIEWEEVWDTFKIGFATPVDYNTRFRMIIGDLATRSKLGESGGCRLGCGCAEEKHIHIVQCPKLQGLWWKLSPQRYTRNAPRKAICRLGPDGGPRLVVHEKAKVQRTRQTNAQHRATEFPRVQPSYG